MTVFPKVTSRRLDGHRETADDPWAGRVTGELKRARLGVSVVFAVCGASFATWLARVPAVQEQLGLTTGQLATGLFGLAFGSVVALLGAGALLTRIGSRAAAVLGAV